ncbi:MAG: type transport system ATP-binding protein [Actinomycetota bacterium]|nr:type transport system ATP-binding protein [Actinomycetota bacterium]
MTDAVRPTSELAIETRGLTKKFGRYAAVNDVDLRVPHGAVFGFLGPNGSGKTTTIRMLLGLASPTRGEARVLGQNMARNVSAVLPRVGALVEGPGFYPYLSGEANLRRLDSADRYAPSSTRDARVASALARVGLTAAARKKVRAYSLGMKQRLGIANALLTPRELLLLDEPTNGLDPQGTREVRALIRSLASEGTTVFVSSHLLAEIEQICTHAAVMSVGSLVAQGTLDELRQVGRSRVRLVTPDLLLALPVLKRFGLTIEPGNPEGVASGSGDPVVVASFGDATLEPERIVAALVHAKVRVRGFDIEGASLEDRFVALTGEGFNVEH